MVPGAIDFTIERQRHAGFVGRRELLAQLDQLLIDDRRDRWVVVTGGPGMGKSAVLTAWLARREGAGDAVPHHFIRRGYAKWDDPATLVGSLVAQIDTRIPGQREAEADMGQAPAERLTTALVRVSQHQLVPRGERLVLLIDALDEFDAPAELLNGDPLAAFLPYKLPRGVSILCASRPRHPYVDALEERGELVQICLDDAPSFADNTATVRAYWDHAAPGLGLDVQFINQAVERASGNLQHAVSLRRRLEGLAPAQRRVEDIPRGLASLIERAWDRISVDLPVASGLGILCAAREALSLDELGRVAGWLGAGQRKTFIRGARELLVESQRPGNVPEYRLQHDAIRAHIAGAVGADALAEYHRALAQKVASWPAGQDAFARRYALRHALLHRAEAGEWADAWRIASDMSFLEAKCRELGAGDAEADVARTADRCRASSGGAFGKRFDDLVRAMGRESHWLHTAPDATAALVWNRLRLLGWETSELESQLRVPERVEFLRVRHAATRESPALIRDLAGHTDSVNACAVTPDGRHVVSASDDRTLKVWELASGRAVATLKDHPDLVTACAVTPDGRHVVSASEDRTLRVWELASGRAVATLKGHTSLVTACAVTPDGRHVVSASFDKTLKVWELASRRAVATLRGHTDSVTACAVTPDGRHVVSASYDHTLKVWELATGRAVASLQGHTRWVIACAVTPDGRHAVSASYDHTLKVWELASRRAVATLWGHIGPVTACAVTPDGRKVVSGSDDHTLKVWELASGCAVATLQGHTGWVGACAVTPDCRHAISASKDKTLKVWELASGRAVAAPPGHILSVTACAVTADGRHAVSASEDKTLKVWELASGRTAATLQGHSDGVTACAMTPDGRQVLSASRDKTLRVWDLASAREVAALQGHTSWVHACVVTPDGGHAISASEDKTLKVWELASACAVATLQGDTHGVTACAVTPDGRSVISASYDQTLKVWELASGHQVATLRGHTGPVTACAVTPDGRPEISASYDNTLKLWELASGGVVATLQGHTDWVIACAVTLDGRRVVSTSEDQTLKVWDLSTGTCLVTHRGTGRYTAIGATTSTFIAGDAAGGVWFLDMPGLAPTRVTRPTSGDLLTRLSGILPAQFKEVLFRANVPAAHIPGDSAPQSMRAIDMIRYFEQRDEIEQLAEIIDEVACS